MPGEQNSQVLAALKQDSCLYTWRQPCKMSVILFWLPNTKYWTCIWTNARLGQEDKARLSCPNWCGSCHHIMLNQRQNSALDSDFIHLSPSSHPHTKLPSAQIPLWTQVHIYRSLHIISHRCKLRSKNQLPLRVYLTIRRRNKKPRNYTHIKKTPNKQTNPRETTLMH